jgi:hypothetical protein
MDYSAQFSFFGRSQKQSADYTGVRNNKDPSNIYYLRFRFPFVLHKKKIIQTKK